MTTPMDIINQEVELFGMSFYRLLDDFRKATGCHIKKINLQHQYHHKEYESTVADIEVGLIGEPFFIKKEKKNEDNA